MTSKPRFFYGWVIVAVGFLAIITYGIFYSYSAFITALEAHLSTSRAGVSAAFTIWLAVYSACALPMGWLCDRYGPRKLMWLAALLIGGGLALCSQVTSTWQLYLLFGVVAAIGHGAIFVVPTSTVSRWFVQRRGLAVGIAASGLGFGLLVVPPITEQIIRASGWQSGFIFLGVLAFVLNMIVGTFIRSRPEDKGLRAYGASSSPLTTVVPTTAGGFSLAETLRTKAFWLIYFVCVFGFSAEQMIIVHVVPYSGTVGITPAQASLGLSFLGIGNIIGRIGAGGVSDRIGRLPTLTVCCGIQALTMFALLAIGGHPLLLYLIMLVLGFGYGGWGILNVVALGDFFGVKNMGAIVGVYFTTGIWAGFLGPLLGGAIFDATQSYHLAILIAGAISVIAIVLALLIRPVSRPSVQMARQ